MIKKRFGAIKVMQSVDTFIEDRYQELWKFATVAWNGIEDASLERSHKIIQSTSNEHHEI